jgi:hypothetical protein
LLVFEDLAVIVGHVAEQLGSLVLLVLAIQLDRAGFSTDPPGQRPGLLVPSPPVRARRAPESGLVN